MTKGGTGSCCSEDGYEFYGGWGLQGTLALILVRHKSCFKGVEEDSEDVVCLRESLKSA